MNYIKEIIQLHNKGFVILAASRSTNAPIGWKRASGKKKWGYVEEMADPNLAVYKSTFSATLLAKSHCGFYLGHNQLCCIDLDTKKTTVEETTALKDLIIKQLGDKVAVEVTKSNGYHIYFRHAALENVPDWTGKGKDNWIEVYYSKRFIACYLSDSKRYKLVHGTITNLPLLSKADHAKLEKILSAYRGKVVKLKARKTSKLEVDKETWDEAENYTKQLEERGLDITGDNGTWFKIGKAFASAFGEKGFEMFDRVSMFSPLYNADTIRDVYQRYVEDDTRRNGTKISIATFFKMCEEAGLQDLRTAQTLQLNQVSKPKQFEITVSKKDSAAEKAQTIVTEFIKQVPICCLDSATFYIFKDTHWQKYTVREVLEYLFYFIDNSTLDSKVAKLAKTVPYIELMLKGLKYLTHRNSITPHLSDSNGSIFINMQNGVLCLDNNKAKLLDHEAKYNFTNVLPYGYDASALCPKFDKWINSQIPDKSLHEKYYAFVASCFTRDKVDAIMMLVGPTSTGKSSLIEVTKRLVGEENSVAISATTLFGGSPSAEAQAMQMENKLLIYDTDAQPFKQKEMLLKVANQEPIQGWQMNITRREVTNYGRFIAAANPAGYSVYDDAIARRIIIIPMETYVEKDNTVMDEIYKEMPGIFNYIINKGLAYLKKHGGRILVTEQDKNNVAKFHMDNRETIRWFKDSGYVVLKKSYDKGPKKTLLEKLQAANPNVKIEFTNITAMYENFRDWLASEGYVESKYLLRKHFVNDLKLYGGIEELVVRTKDGVSRGVYLGQKMEKNAYI